MQDFEDRRDQLAGRIVLVTGAAAGMGREHAVLMAGRGATLIGQDMNEAGLTETGRMVREAGGAWHQFACDVTDHGAFAAGAKAAEAKLGRIDVLVNNAGVHAAKAFEEITEAEFDRMYAINVTGLFFATQAVVPGMKARRNGKIVNIASGAAQRGNPLNSHYGSSKAAVLGLTKAWAKELAPWGIQVNAVSPGPVKSEMALRARGEAGMRERAEKEIPLKRYGEQVEQSYGVCFLASAESDFVTGQVLPINGGTAIVGI